MSDTINEPINEYFVDLPTITKLLIKHHKIHSGIYRASLEFEVMIGSVGAKDTSSETVLPGVITRVRRIGLTALDETQKDAIDAIDAAKYNPLKKSKAPK